MRRYQSGARDNDAACQYVRFSFPKLVELSTNIYSETCPSIFRRDFRSQEEPKRSITTPRTGSIRCGQRFLYASSCKLQPLFSCPQARDGRTNITTQHLAALQETPPKKGLSISKSLSKPQIKHDITSATTNFRRAALFGHAPSQLRLGLAHRTGTLSLPVDHSLSLHYLHLAARRGLAQADFEIANTLFWGSPELLARYPKRAYAHARRAAKDEWSDAYALLGMAYEDGVGVDKDVKTACGWYLKGASKGDRYAERKVEILRGKPVLGFKR
jgi:hypothetical protein